MYNKMEWIEVTGRIHNQQKQKDVVTNGKGAKRELFSVPVRERAWYKHLPRPESPMLHQHNGTSQVRPSREGYTQGQHGLGRGIEALDEKQRRR